VAEFFMRSGWFHFVKGPLDGQDKQLDPNCKNYLYMEEKKHSVHKYKHHLVGNTDVMQYEGEEQFSQESKKGSESNKSISK